MVPGIAPRVAVERLKTFKRLFEERERKMTTYQGGEKLFGLPVHEYPELVKIRKELKLLESLYSLYTDVIVTVNGYNDIIWSDLDLKSIEEEVKRFQDRCKRLPKGMRDWEAFLELKKTIEDFDLLLPLLQDLSHTAVQARHWEQISDVTGHTFKVDLDTFKMKNLLEAPLLEKQPEIHDICFAAVREAEIEQKINAIQDEWSDTNFEFSNFKKRGPIVLNGDRTQEIMLQIEESAMVLAGLLSSPYNKPFKADGKHCSMRLRCSANLSALQFFCGLRSSQLVSVKLRIGCTCNRCGSTWKLSSWVAILQKPCLSRRNALRRLIRAG